MPNEKPKINTPSDPHFFEGEKAKIAWDREFREMLRVNPGIIKTAIQLADRAVAEYNPPDNPIPNYYRQVRFDRKTRKWLEENRHVVLNEAGKIHHDPITGETVTSHAGWKDLTFGRGTILVPGEPLIDETSGLEIVVLGIGKRELPFGFADKIRVEDSEYLKVKLLGKTFFVKRSYVTVNPGYAEFHSTIRAKHILKDLDFVQVIEPKLGFQDKNESWFVSKWEELESGGFGTFDISAGKINDYGQHKEGILYPMYYGTPEFLLIEKKRKDALKQYNLIEKKLHDAGLYDLAANLFYNPETKNWILLDVTGRTTKGLGNPIRDEK